MEVALLDYGAGNVRSIRNAIERVGFRVRLVASPAELASSRVVVFPGVGAFGSTVAFLDTQGYREPLLAYLHSGRPFLGICLGMQTLFDSSEESPGAAGLGLIPGVVARFPAGSGSSVPQIGWNGVACHQGGGASAALDCLQGGDKKVYFVHSYRATVSAANAAWVACTTDYAGGRFISAVSRGGVFATQFHPEKSGAVGLAVFRAFLEAAERAGVGAPPQPLPPLGAPSAPLAARILDTAASPPTRVCRRVIACLDVRSNDAGDLVVTKGDQYDVREHAAPAEGGGGKPAVRNLGKPVDLCARYYEEGADEVTFLNITAFRNEPLDDTPMLGVLEASSERVFVPLTVRSPPPPSPA
jgi:glutamine amidotransferase/cyclase